jgi:hypothetical protein
LGASSGAFGPGIIVQSPTDWSSVRPIVPPKLRSGIGSAVRSGTNLPAASASAALSPRTPFCSIGTSDLAGDPASACSAASRSLSSIIATMAAVPGVIFSAIDLSRPVCT